MAADPAAGGKAAVVGLRPNPSGDGPKLGSPPGKRKAVALADITNTGRVNTTRSLSVADAVKENAKLVQLLNEKTRTIELSRVESQKLHIALQMLRQQNVQLAQANSQMLAELNLGKDRIKTLQHELSCTAALVKIKDSELEKNNKAAKQRRKEVNSQDIMKVAPLKVAAVVTHQIDGSVTCTTEQHLVESKYAVPLTTGCQEPPNDVTTKRGRNKRKLLSTKCTKDTQIMQDHYRPHLQPVILLDHVDPRKSVRRRSTRLNPGSCEVTEVGCSKLPEDDIVPSAPPSFSAQNQHGSSTEKDMKIEANEQLQKEANLKEIQEACSSVPGIESHQMGDTASNIKHSHLAETQSSLPFNIVEPPKGLEDTGDERGANKEKLKNVKDSATEHIINAKCGSRADKPLCHDEKRKSQTRKSTRLGSILSENTMITSETLHEDISAPLPHSSLYASMQQTANHNLADGCSSTKVTEGQVAGRRSLRRAAEKVVSYKEIPLNVKMRRPS